MVFSKKRLLIFRELRDHLSKPSISEKDKLYLLQMGFGNKKDLEEYEKVQKEDYPKLKTRKR